MKVSYAFSDHSPSQRRTRRSSGPGHQTLACLRLGVPQTQPDLLFFAVGHPRSRYVLPRDLLMNRHSCFIVPDGLMQRSQKIFHHRLTYCPSFCPTSCPSFCPSNESLVSGKFLWNPQESVCGNGATGRDRTDDLLFTKQLLCH